MLLAECSRWSWTDVLTITAGIVSSIAALGALWFARDTVRETRALRREDRLARLPELIADLGDLGLRVANGAAHENVTGVPVAKHRLRAAVNATGLTLPACDALVAIDWMTFLHGGRPPAEGENALSAALDEVATLLSVLRERS